VGSAAKTWRETNARLTSDTSATTAVNALRGREQLGDKYMADDREDPNDSLTATQINIVRGRKWEELSVNERLAFANAAPRPFIPKRNIPEEFRVALDTDTLPLGKPKLDILYDAEQLEDKTLEARRLKEALATEREDSKRADLIQKLEKGAARIRELEMKISRYRVPKK
jgi:hypothetical protein